jgi:hypothetical protein
MLNGLKKCEFLCGLIEPDRHLRRPGIVHDPKVRKCLSIKESLRIADLTKPVPSLADFSAIFVKRVNDSENLTQG